MRAKVYMACDLEQFFNYGVAFEEFNDACRLYQGRNVVLMLCDFYDDGNHDVMKEGSERMSWNI